LAQYGARKQAVARRGNPLAYGRRAAPVSREYKRAGAREIQLSEQRSRTILLAIPLAFRGAIMKHRRKYFLGLVLTILLYMLANTSSVLGIRMRLSGALIANSVSQQSFYGTPIRLLTVAGDRWVSWDETKPAAVYYALVLLPTASACNISSGGGSNGFFLHTGTWSWLARKDKGDQEQELRLEATYHPSRRTLTIDSRSYYLADGNLFVIRFDDGMRPVVRQLDATINENVEPQLIFNLFKSLLHGDGAAQKLISARDDSAIIDCERRR
jgi:hypothetical protein